MKKIINGKMYNTETARLFAEYSNGLYVNDLDYVNERIYIKKTGEFFIVGDGGARSIYSKKTGQNSWIGDTVIIPLTDEEAKKWIAEHLEADYYINTSYTG